MKIKPVDNVYFGAHLPPKQHDMEESKMEKWSTTNREAMETVLAAAEKFAMNNFYDGEHKKIKEAIWQMQDYKNDVMEE